MSGGFFALHRLSYYVNHEKLYNYDVNLHNQNRYTDTRTSPTKVNGMVLVGEHTIQRTADFPCNNTEEGKNWGGEALQIEGRKYLQMMPTLQ